MEPSIVRRHLRDQLRALHEELSTGPDRALAERLLVLVETDQLDLPPFPDVARELDELLQQSTTDILQIARVVERDPGLVRRVWTHARSSMYASAPRSLHHAVARVGLDALWRIGMSVCLNDNVFRVEGLQGEAAAVRAHGIVVAEVAAQLAGERRGSLYLAGLLHGVGDLLVLRSAAAPGAAPASIEAVRRVADRTRAGLSVLVAHSWKLDDVVIAGLGFHPNPDKAPRSQQRAARIVRAANICAHATASPQAGYPDPVPLVQALGLDARKGLSRAEEVLAELARDDRPPA
jgi:HD-like signal output (HDOD) protein